MKRIFIFILFTLTLFAQKSQMAKDIEKIKFPEIDWKVPEIGKDIDRIILKSNAILFIKEEKKLPIVNISIFLKKSGPGYLEYGEFLVSELLKEMIIKGGTDKYTPEEITNLLETNAIDISVQDEDEIYRIDCSFLSNLTDIALPLIEEIIFKPRFDEKVMKLEMERVLDNFKRTMENPSSALFYLAGYVLFPEHPASRYADIEKFRNLKKERLFEIHKMFFQPKNMIISVIGDFNKDELKNKMETLFNDKYNNDLEIRDVKDFKPMAKNKIFFYNLRIPQGYIMIIHEGENKYSDDFFDLTIMNDILGWGGFTSRIVSKVRNEKGLAYSTWGYYDKLSLFKGSFKAFSATKSDAVYDAIYYIIEEMKRIKKEKVTDKELKIAKESLINSTISRLGNPYNFMSRVAGLELYERPLNFYSTYVENVKKVNIDGVYNAANRYLKPEDVSIIIVGDKSKIDTLKLKEFGNIEFIEIKH